MSETRTQEPRQKQWSVAGVATIGGILIVPSMMVAGFITLLSMVIN